MKNIYIIIIATLFLLRPTISYPQGEDAAVAAGAVLGALTISTILSMDDFEESLELKATEWVLANMDIKKFNLEMIPFESSFIGIQKSGSYSYSAVKTQFRNSLQLGGHLSGAVPFKLYEFEINDLPNGKFDFTIVNRYILMMYSFPGFITDRGINYTDEFKYIYNEKSLGMFHKSTKRLFQLEAKSIREIHGFLKRKTPITLKN